MTERAADGLVGKLKARLPAGLCALALAAVLASGLPAAPALAQSASCNSLELHVGIEPTEEPECLRGSSNEDDFRGTWEYLQMTSGDRFIAVALERAGVRSVFYRPTIETVVATLLGDEIDDIVWGAGIEDERYDVRRFEATVGKSRELPCVGFVELGGRSTGSEVGRRFRVISAI
jgi:hypothetical protein